MDRAAVNAAVGKIESDLKNLRQQIAKDPRSPECAASLKSFEDRVAALKRDTAEESEDKDQKQPAAAKPQA